MSYPAAHDRQSVTLEPEPGGGHFDPRFPDNDWLGSENMGGGAVPVEVEWPCDADGSYPPPMSSSRSPGLRPRRPGSSPPQPKPPGFGFEGPSAEYVERARSYLAAIGERERQPLMHSFENRQDALLVALEAKDLSDEAFASARQALFELFAMIELGWPPGESSQVVADPPPALRACCDAAQAEAVRAVLAEGLAELWSSRRRRASR